MSRNILIVVDMQNDFISGSLGTSEAQELPEAVAMKIRAFEGEVLYTQDTHGEDYLESAEGKDLPVEHCIHGTPGWEVHPVVAEALAEHDAQQFIKYTFGSTDLVDHLVASHMDEKIESIELLGICTDICVVSNALMIKAALPEIPISVDSTLCAGVTPEKHDAALEVLRSCLVEVH